MFECFFLHFVSSRMFIMVVNLARRGIRMKSVAWQSFSACFLFLLTIIFFMGVSVQKAEENVKPRLSFAYNTEDRLYRSFSPVGVFNITSLLLSAEDNTLYIGAREVLFALNLSDISRLQLHHNFTWSTPERKREECSFKGKSLHTDCFNYIKILLRLNTTHLYVCGTYAFSPVCAYINTVDFSLVRSSIGEIVTEDGRSHCPYNHEFKSTAIIADGDLYAATVSNFQGNEPVIYKSLGQGPTLKTENSLNWLQVQQSSTQLPLSLFGFVCLYPWTVFFYF